MTTIKFRSSRQVHSTDSGALVSDSNKCQNKNEEQEYDEKRNKKTQQSLAAWRKRHEDRDSLRKAYQEKVLEWVGEVHGIRKGPMRYESSEGASKEGGKHENLAS